MSQAYHLLDHLEYVRLRLIRAIVYYFGGVVIGLLLSQRIIVNLVTSGVVPGLVFLSPTEAFFSRLKLALAVGLIVAMPFIVAQVWGLLEPALAPQYKRMSFLAIGGASVLFMSGVAFGFFAVLPMAVRFLIGFGVSSGISPEISIASFVSFVIGMTLPFGLVFQLPVVVIFLVRAGVLSPQQLRINRKYVIFASFVVATVLTPPDVVTQFMLALPLILLYELSVLMAARLAPKDGGHR